MVIEVLYPEFGNLFGDLSNIKYLKKCLPDATIIKTSVNSVPTFVKQDVNMIYLGPTTEKQQEIIIKKLKKHKDRIEELINKNIVFLFTGNSLEIMGKYIEKENGEKIECLGLFDVYAKRDMLNRKNSNIIGVYKDIEIVGFKSQFTMLYGKFENQYFTKLITGMGNNESTSFEGIKRKNFIGTYIIGPILILNPLFTKKLLKTMGVKNIKLAFEDEVMKAYETRVNEFHNKFKKGKEN